MQEEQDVIQRPQELLSRRRIRIYSIIGVTFVLAFELVKASHHSIWVGPGHEIDIWSTAFWGLDALAAAIVTFVMIKVAFSSDRLEEVLVDQRRIAVRLSNSFTQTIDGLRELRTEMQSDSIKTSDELKKQLIQMQNVVRAISAVGGIIKTMNSEELLQLLEANIDIQASFLQNLSDLTAVWGELILNEGKSTYSDNGRNFGLICWGVALDTYLKEEVRDIKNQTVATNIVVYLKLISSLVDKILVESEKDDLKIEVSAISVYLPVEYYNWNEYGSEDDPYVHLSGTNLDFMDAYREKIKTWLQGQNKRLTFKRILLLMNEQKLESEEFRMQLLDLAVPSLDRLRRQSTLRILCNTRDNEPRLFSIAEIQTYISISPDRGFLERYRNESAYAIARDFRQRSQFNTSGIVDYSLFDIFKRQLHSEPHDANALCLIFDDDSYVNQLQYLPTVFGGSDGSQEMRCSDFLAIRMGNGETSKLIACIATHLRPDYDTMALRLITEKSALDKIEEFIKFASSPDNSKSLNDAVST